MFQRLWWDAQEALPIRRLADTASGIAELLNGVLIYKRSSSAICPLSLSWNRVLALNPNDSKSFVASAAGRQ
jgi:hypothetical protein